MGSSYDENAKVFKALGDANRLKIIDMLSSGEKCACEILACFEFTQPTLSHHMKVLIDCNLVKSRKEGTWNYYTLDKEMANRLMIFLMSTITYTKEWKCDKCDCKCKNSREEL